MITGYPAVELALANANAVNSEYLTPRDYIIETDYDQNSESISSSSSKVSKLRVRSRHCSFGTLVKDTTKLYRFWHYMSCVHISSISSVMYSFVIVMIKWTNHTTLVMRIVSALLDIYFLIKIYVSAHLIYKDTISGVLVRDLKLVRKRYFCSLTRFGLDLLTIFPFEYIALAITSDVNISKYGYSARVFRFLFLYKYYKEQEENLNVRHHLRLTYLAYRVVFGIEWSACIWYVL